MENTTRILEKVIEVGDKTYRVRKMDALTGSFVMKQLFQNLLPMVGDGQKLIKAIEAAADDSKGEDGKGLTEDDAVLMAMSSLPTLLEKISEDDIRTLMTKALNYTDVSLPAGWMQVMTGSHFSYPDLEYDLMTCLVLCVHCIAFNGSGFFGESGFPFSSMIAALTSQPGRKTSTKKPTRQ